MTCHEAGRLLDAYVDDELSVEDAAAVAAHIDQCPSCRRQLEDREALRRLIRMVPYGRASDELRQTVMLTRTRAGIPRSAWMWAAAAILVISIGSLVGWRAWRTTQTTSLVADAIVASHVNGLATQLIAVQSTDQHTVKPWFQGKLDFSPPVWDLGAEGFPLVGGRVDVVDGRPVAVLVYQRRLHVISVMIWPADIRTALTDARTIRGFHERHWTQEAMSVWAVSDVAEDDLSEFARLFSEAHS